MIVVPMGYIRFVFICAIILLSLLSSPVYCSTEQKAMIYYSEDTLSINETVHLEQGYSFKLVDANKDSGDILVKVYYKGKELEVGNSFGDEDNPFEYIITTTKDNEETDYLVLKITPVDFNEKKGSIYVEMNIEQFFDPEQDDNDFLILDASKSVKVGKTLSLKEGYRLEASDLQEDSVILELSKDDKLLKKEEVGIDDIFSYSKDVDGYSRTIFIARVNKFFESSNSSTVFLKDVTQRSDVGADYTGDTSNNSNETKNETKSLMSTPDDINHNIKDVGSNGTGNVQNYSLFAIDGENSSKYKDVNTDTFMPILFMVIIVTGIVISKFS